MKQLPGPGDYLAPDPADDFDLTGMVARLVACHGFREEQAEECPDTPTEEAAENALWGAINGVICWGGGRVLRQRQWDAAERMVRDYERWEARAA